MWDLKNWSLRCFSDLAFWQSKRCHLDMWPIPRNWFSGSCKPPSGTDSPAFLIPLWLYPPANELFQFPGGRFEKYLLSPCLDGPKLFLCCNTCYSPCIGIFGAMSKKKLSGCNTNILYKQGTKLELRSQVSGFPNPTQDPFRFTKEFQLMHKTYDPEFSDLCQLIEWLVPKTKPKSGLGLWVEITFRKFWQNR